MKSSHHLEEEIENRLNYALDIPDGIDLKPAVNSMVDLFSSLQQKIENCPQCVGLREEFKAELQRKIGWLGKEQIELYEGKLPFVVFFGNAKEEEKIIIYRQALSDVLALFKK